MTLAWDLVSSWLLMTGTPLCWTATASAKRREDGTADTQRMQALGGARYLPYSLNSLRLVAPGVLRPTGRTDEVQHDVGILGRTDGFASFMYEQARD